MNELNKGVSNDINNIVKCSKSQRLLVAVTYLNALYMFLETCSHKRGHQHELRLNHNNLVLVFFV